MPAKSALEARRLRVPKQLESLAKGTATRARGRARVEAILQAAYELLGSADFSEFSMRSVAARAGVDLKNVQYYFSTKKDLVRALLECLGYGHEEDLASSEDDGVDPVERLRRHLRQWLDDNLRPEIRRLNIHSWVIFDSSFEYSGEGMVQFYQRFLVRIEARIKDIDPTLKLAEVRVRARLVASLLEGAMLTFCDLKGKNLSNAKERVLATALALAAG